MNQEKNLHWVQLLRGVAALLVVLTHGRYALLGTPSWPLADQLMTPGAMGVDLFFIISGFIMYYSTTGNPGGAGEAARFLIKRFARVWPAYAVVTLAAVYVLNGGTAYFHVAANRLAFWHTLAMLPADPHQAPYFGLTLAVGWTLEFEMYFYLIFAASMLFKRLRWFVLASWVLLTVILLPLGHAGFDMSVVRDHGFTAGYMSIATNPFVLEFLAGVLIGWAHRQPWLRIPGRQLAWHVLGLSVAFAVFAVYSRAVDGHGPTHYGWPLALMVLAMALASKTVEIRAPALFIWLGSISYSLYLTHPIAQGLELKALQMAGLNSLWSSWWSVLLSTACALSVAALSHHYLEQGLSNKVRKLLLRLLTRRAEAPTQAAPAQPIKRRA
ncbi:acyltransferase family protein [Rugamonas rivuli]|uniref:Acyltransferase family protein n=1 Tax=Rugamonas rivuli TaxID=2743358 RepID=A0A843SDQ2_9BURK|nr:acyltransferase [Rugamonas rivuli]MQA21222.1 acyltransferase family protein [Rugamonas rivuli]